VGIREWDPCGKQSWTERYAGINHSKSGSACRWQPFRNDNRNGALMLSGCEALSVNLGDCPDLPCSPRWPHATASSRRAEMATKLSAVWSIAISAFGALFGHGAMSDLSPLCAPKRTSADHSKFMGSRPSAASRRPVPARPAGYPPCREKSAAACMAGRRDRGLRAATRMHRSLGSTPTPRYREFAQRKRVS
jgi:hypothetical protein